MKITINNVEVNIKQGCDKITEHYVKILTQLINKGMNNPAFQLHVLCVIHTGKTFTDLIYDDSKESEDVDAILALIKDLPLGLLAKNIKIENSGRPDLTETTVEDILKENDEDKKPEK